MYVTVHTAAVEQGTEERLCNDGFVVFVAVDGHTKPVGIDPVMVNTEEEEKMWTQGEERRTRRLEERAALVHASA